MIRKIFFTSSLVVSIFLPVVVFGSPVPNPGRQWQLRGSNIPLNECGPIICQSNISHWEVDSDSAVGRGYCFCSAGGITPPPTPLSPTPPVVPTPAPIQAPRASGTQTFIPRCTGTTQAGSTVTATPANAPSVCSQQCQQAGKPNAVFTVQEGCCCSATFVNQRCEAPTGSPLSSVSAYDIDACNQGCRAQRRANGSSYAFGMTGLVNPQGGQPVCCCGGDASAASSASTAGSGGSSGISSDPNKLPNPLGDNANTLQKLLGRIIKGLLGVTGSIALLMFIWGGFTWMTANGEQQKIKDGLNILIWATLGLGLIFGSYAIVEKILRIILPV